MTISKILPTLTRILGAAALLTLAACEPHDADSARAFYDPHYEHQLHAENEIPRSERLYYPEAPHDPVLITNTANPANYTSVFRGSDMVYPPNPAAGAKWPETHHDDSEQKDGHAEEKHADDHGAIASPPKTFFKEPSEQ